MSRNKYQAPNPLAERNHNLTVTIKYEPCSPYLSIHKDNKDRVEYLTNIFSQIFCSATGGKFASLFNVPNDDAFFITFHVHNSTYALFETDYQRFMDAVFQSVPVHLFGVSRLSVFNLAPDNRRAEQRIREVKESLNRMES